MPVSDLLTEVEACLDRFDLDQATHLCQQILQQDEHNIDALQLYASTLIEQGQVDQAREVLKKAVTVSPNEGFEKFLALAQITSGKEALNYYSEAARILKEKLPSVTEEGEVKEMTRQLSNIYCSAAELYLTDLCDEDNAETECESLVQEAIKVDVTNPEGYRVQADLLLVQGRQEDAIKSIRTCLTFWEALDFDDLMFPLYDQRIAMAKVLIEVNLFEDAIRVLEGLLEEDEDVIDTWYLMGVAQLSTEDAEGALEAFVSALSLIVRLPEVDRDEEQKTSIIEFLTQLGVDAQKIWADLEEQMAEILAAQAQL